MLPNLQIFLWHFLNSINHRHRKALGMAGAIASSCYIVMQANNCTKLGNAPNYPPKRMLLVRLWIPPVCCMYSQHVCCILAHTIMTQHHTVDCTHLLLPLLMLRSRTRDFPPQSIRTTSTISSTCIHTRVHTEQAPQMVSTTSGPFLETMVSAAPDESL